MEENTSFVSPEPVAPAPVASTPASPTPEMSIPEAKSNKTMLIAAVVGGVLLLAMAAYIVMNMVLTPAQVKEKAQLAQPVFVDLNQSMKKIEDHLLDESSSSDSDAMERDAQKGKTLLKDAKKDRDSLNAQLETMTASPLTKYKNALKTYLTEANKLITTEEQNTTLAQGYVQPLRDYEKLSVDISGSSSYLYSDPDKYISIMNDSINKEEQIIASLQKIQAQGDMGELHQAFIKTMQAETTLLKEIKQAVEDRQSSAISAATKKYTESAQSNAKDLGRIADKLKDSVKEMKSDLEVQEGKVNSEYSSLKDNYKF